MNILILKLGATGDVVRTTTLLRRFCDHVSWITEAKNAGLLRNTSLDLRCLTWEERGAAKDRSYDLVVNLEDTLEAGRFIETLDYRQLFGAYIDGQDLVRYSDDSKHWFDLSLISRFGCKEADKARCEVKV